MKDAPKAAFAAADGARSGPQASRPSHFGIWRLGAAMIAGAAAAPTLAHAQSAAPSQTPPGETALDPSPQAQFQFPPAQGLTPPEGAENIQIAVTDIAVEGQFGELQAISTRIESAYIGRDLSVADVYGFAVQLQQAYFDAGFPLARIVVPPQELGADGRVRIIVVDGFVERVDASQLPERVRARVERVLETLVGKRRPTREKLERALLIAGDTAGLRLNSALTPGAATGATVLVLSGEHDQIAGAVSVDNRVSEELGRWQATGSVVFQSLLGHGERFYALAAVPTDHDALRSDSRRNFIGFGVQAPIGTDGATWGVSLDYSSTHPKGDVAAQKLQSEYVRLGANFSMPVVRSRSLNVVAGVSFDAVTDIESTRFIGDRVTLSADRTRAVRFNVDIGKVFPTGARAGFSTTFSHGLDVFGARSAEEATALKPLSRAGADAEFGIIEAGFSLASAPINGDIWSFSARGQHAMGEPLVRSEQFSPVSWDGMSGPTPGMLTGDNGAVARLEMQHPIILDIEQGGYMAPYVFANAAVVSLENPSALERRNTNVRGGGIGVRFGIGRSTRGGYDVNATLELSRTNSDRDDLDREWISAAVTARF